MARIKRTDDEWRELLAKQQTSGQTQEQWCAANGVSLYTFRDRASRSKKTETEPAKRPAQLEPMGWVEIIPEREPEKISEVCIEHCGFVIRVRAGTDAELLTAALMAVKRVCC